MLSILNSGLYLWSQYTNYSYDYPVQTDDVTDILNPYWLLCTHIIDLLWLYVHVFEVPLSNYTITQVWSKIKFNLSIVLVT